MRPGTSEAGPQAIHSLAFRVMRLCQPSLHIDNPLKFAHEDLDPAWQNPALHTKEGGAHSQEPGFPFSSRMEQGEGGAKESFGLTPMLVLPQSFGTVYLGETFCSYISVGNFSPAAVTNVSIKAELQTERKHSLLYDTSQAPLDILPSGGRHDFIVVHDLKEMGAHTLACSTVYTDTDGEKKYYPQNFKFSVANPLSVRTKVRHLPGQHGGPGTTLLEACIENTTRRTLFLSNVKFEPSPAYAAEPIQADQSNDHALPPDGTTSSTGGDMSAPAQVSPLISKTLREATLVKANGGSRFYLFRLWKSAGVEAGGGGSGMGAGTLGKLEIRWRVNMGEQGRLQTQQILGGLPTQHSETLRLQIQQPLPQPQLQVPFVLRLSLTRPSTSPVSTDLLTAPQPNSTTHPSNDHSASVDGIAPTETLTVNYTPDNVNPAVVLDGLRPPPRVDLGPDFSSCEIFIQLVALAPGVQRVGRLVLCSGVGGEERVSLPPFEIFVQGSSEKYKGVDTQRTASVMLF